jgi:hypothetical protein
LKALSHRGRPRENPDRDMPGRECPLASATSQSHRATPTISAGRAAAIMGLRHHRGASGRAARRRRRRGLHRSRLGRLRPHARVLRGRGTGAERAARARGARLGLHQICGGLCRRGARARQAKRGIFAAENTPAWEFRRLKWEGAVATLREAPNPDCPIKGNVSRDGARIFHMPWQAITRGSGSTSATGSAGFVTKEKPSWPAGGGPLDKSLLSRRCL